MSVPRPIDVNASLTRRWASGVWKIVHYNLAITIPNERFAQVRELLEAEAEPEPAAE